jgi:hypothetical protein
VAGEKHINFPDAGKERNIPGNNRAASRRDGRYLMVEVATRLAPYLHQDVGTIKHAVLQHGFPQLFLLVEPVF